MDLVINQVIHTMADVYGLDISMYDWKFLDKIIAARCIEAGAIEPADYLAYIATSPGEPRLLMQCLNISYTEFFRNSLSFAILERWVLPQLIKSKPPGSELRIWSAGCSTGQEAYSVALLLNRIHQTRCMDFTYRIIGTDISQRNVDQAVKGEYRENELLNVPLRYLKTDFYSVGELYTVAHHIRQKVSFSLYNLLDAGSLCPSEGIFGSYDLVLCCNVLYYYQPAQQAIIIKKIIRSLAPQGAFMAGETERYLIKQHPDLQMITSPATIFQKRGGEDVHAV